MLRLIIDTALGYMSIGLARDADLLASVIIDRPETITTLSVGAIDFLIGSVHQNKKKLDEVVLSAGPGTFTSLRTGISLAKGIGMALGIPLVPVSTLDAMANTTGCTDGNMIAAVDGKNNNIYIAEYRVKDNTVERVTPDTLLRADSGTPMKRQYPVYLIGFDVERYADVLAKSYNGIIKWEKLDIRRTIRALHSIADKRLYGIQQVAAADYVPVYLRQPDINSRKET